jgi:hypothetical protein
MPSRIEVEKDQGIAPQKMQPTITPSYRKGEKKQGSLNVNRLSNVTDPGRLKKGSREEKKELRKAVSVPKESPQTWEALQPKSEISPQADEKEKMGGKKHGHNRELA